MEFQLSNRDDEQNKILEALDLLRHLDGQVA